MVDQATQTPTSSNTALSTTVVDQAARTLAWVNQDKGHEAIEHTSFQFMDLPLELRREVYRHYINDLPPLMFTSPQICREVYGVTDRTLTFQLFNGLFCPPSLKQEAAEVAAAQLASFHDRFRGQNVRLRIELQCPRTDLLLDFYYKPLMDTIGVIKMPPVEVYMTKGEVCSMCARHPQPDPEKFVRELVERVERLRDGRAVRYGVQTRCDCRSRRLE